MFGRASGIVGSLQALETIKLIIGKGESLAGRLVLFDALTLKFRELKLRKNAHCPMWERTGRFMSSSITTNFAEYAAKRNRKAIYTCRKSARAN